MLTMMPMAACDGSNADPILPEQPGQPGNSDGGDEDDSTNPTNPIPGGNGRYLVLYCSRTGSTERMAQQIQQTLDCDILEVEPQTPYESDYNGMLNRAQEELAAIRQGNYPAKRIIDIVNFPRAIVAYHKRQIVFNCVLTIFLQVNLELAEVHGFGNIITVAAHCGELPRA